MENYTKVEEYLEEISEMVDRSPGGKLNDLLWELRSYLEDIAFDYISLDTEADDASDYMLSPVRNFENGYRAGQNGDIQGKVEFHSDSHLYFREDEDYVLKLVKDFIREDQQAYPENYVEDEDTESAVYSHLIKLGFTDEEIDIALAELENEEIPQEAEQIAKELEDLITDGLEDLDKSESGLIRDLAVLAALFGFIASGSVKADAGDIDKALDKLAKNPSVSKVYDIESNFTEGQPGSGRGNYKIEVGPYVIKGTYFGAGAMTNHKLQTFTKKNATDEQLEEYKPFHDKMVKLLRGVDLSSVDLEKEQNKNAEKLEKEQNKNAEKLEKEQNKKAKKLVDNADDAWDSYSKSADDAWDSYTSNF